MLIEAVGGHPFSGNLFDFARRSNEPNSTATSSWARRPITYSGSLPSHRFSVHLAR